MSGRPFFDTTILIYSIALEDPRAAIAEKLLADGFISVQVLNEFAAVAHRKLKMPWRQIGDALSAVRTLWAPPTPLSVETHEAAQDRSTLHQRH
jgi:predicted nucleic acid-binding protein